MASLTLANFAAKPQEVQYSIWIQGFESAIRSIFRLFSGVGYNFFVKRFGYNKNER